jgi:hypothetical protein
MFNAPERKTAETFLQAAIQKYAVSAPRLSAWLEENLSEGFTVFDFPLEHRRSIRTTNSLERINKEIRRRTRSTLNHVALTCLDGALRRYLEEHGYELERPITIQMPVSLRQPGETRAGNKIGIIQVELSPPTDDPYVRLRNIGFSLRGVRNMVDNVAAEAIESYTILSCLVAQTAETLNLSEVVTVTGTPTLALNDGGRATYISGSGTNALTFSYTVGASDSNVPALAITQVNLPNGAIVKDAAGNAANLSGALTTFTGLQINPPAGSDLFFRNSSTGAFTEWQSTGSSFTPNVYVNNGVDNSWTMATGDFNGDGKTDLLFRNTSGLFTEWQSTGSSFNSNVYVDGTVSTAFALAAIGDFNGDGKSDLIWRNTSTGLFTEWQSTGSGFTPNVDVDGTLSAVWALVGAGDFNGDGKTDLLFRNTSTGGFTEWQSNGNGFTPNVYVDSSVGTAWTLAGTGDFNGDGKTDLLFRNTSTGGFTEWQSTGTAFSGAMPLRGRGSATASGEATSRMASL